MKKTRYTEEQVVRISGGVKNGKRIAEVGRQYGVSEQTIRRWRAKWPFTRKTVAFRGVLIRKKHV